MKNKITNARFFINRKTAFFEKARKKANKNTTNKLWIALLLSVVFFSGYSQNNDSLFQRLFPRNQIRISATPILFQPANIKNQGAKILNTYPSPSIDFGLEYFHSLNSNLGFSIGLHWNNISYFYGFDVFVPDYKGNIDQLAIAPISQLAYFPISLQKNISLQNRLSIISTIGVSFNYIVHYQNREEASYISDTITNKINNLFVLTLESREQKWFMGYFVKFGISKITKKKNTSYHINFIANYTPKAVGIGVYAFNNIPNKSSGTIKTRLNYIGIEFAYGISLSKKGKHLKR